MRVVSIAFQSFVIVNLDRDAGLDFTLVLLANPCELLLRPSRVGTKYSEWETPDPPFSFQRGGRVNADHGYLLASHEIDEIPHMAPICN